MFLDFRADSGMACSLESPAVYWFGFVVGCGPDCRVGLAPVSPSRVWVSGRASAELWLVGEAEQLGPSDEVHRGHHASSHALLAA